MSRHVGVRTQAMSSSMPVVIGYLPIAFAFGMTGVTHGVSPEMTIAMSAIIFAGASQFVLLAAISASTPWLWVIGLCALMDIRHLLYGSLLKATLGNTATPRRLGIAFFLTDEVFATALIRLSAVNAADRGIWMMWMGGCSYLAWVMGTALGAYLGLQLSESIPLLAKAMPFALPALFLILVHETFKPGHRTAIIASALTACALWAAGLSGLALLLGAFVGCVSTLWGGKNNELASE